jgi:hypothetical protein
LISGVITGVTAGAIGFIGDEELIPPDDAAGLRFAALFFAGFFLAAFRAGFFFAAFFEDFFFEDFFFDAFFLDAFFFATRFLEDFLEDFFFADFLAGFFFAAFFFAAMVKLLSRLDRLTSRDPLPGCPHQASVIHMNEIGERILFARMLNKVMSRVTI